MQIINICSRIKIHIPTTAMVWSFILYWLSSFSYLSPSITSQHVLGSSSDKLFTLVSLSQCLLLGKVNLKHHKIWAERKPRFWSLKYGLQMNQFLKSATTRRDKIEVRLWYGDWSMTTLEWNWAKNKFPLNLRKKNNKKPVSMSKSSTQ